MKKHFTRNVLSLLLICSFIIAMAIPVDAAAAVTTPEASLSKATDLAVYTAIINGANNSKLYYRVFSQSDKVWGKKNYVAKHGCAVCSLTTVLSGRSAKYKNYTPDKTYKILEKKVFGKRTWNSNYKKRFNNQMPISLYGISKVLKAVGVKNKYVRKFKNANAVKQIQNHLKKGKPVVIEVNNHTQKNGNFSSKYNNKWALSKHTMVLLGMTDTGKVIVADSATRKWSGTSQRIKYANMSQLVRYMIPCKKSTSSCYYNGISESGGYILVQ